MSEDTAKETKQPELHSPVKKIRMLADVDPFEKDDELQVTSDDLRILKQLGLKRESYRILGTFPQPMPRSEEVAEITDPVLAKEREAEEAEKAKKAERLAKRAAKRNGKKETNSTATASAVSPSAGTSGGASGGASGGETKKS